MIGRKLLVIVTVAVVGTAAVPSLAVGQQLCLMRAWESFNRADYALAVEHAERCIDDFALEAQRMQDSLIAAGVPAPKPGEPHNQAAADAINRRGVLNDAATAFYVKGRSTEFLFRAGGAGAAEQRSMAIASYEGACRLYHAMAWDPQGWFWSPCEVSRDRLTGLGHAPRPHLSKSSERGVVGRWQALIISTSG